MSDLSIRGVVKSFGSTRVLQGLSLEISQGSVFAVLGPSGAGKTTLLRTIAGFERIDAGGILVGGEIVAGPKVHVAPEKRGVAVVPQEQALFPHLTVAKNIGYGVPHRGRKARVQEMLEFAGLHNLGDRMPHQLSGGQQQRVALARALAPRPAVILLDEPFTGLDAALRATIREDISSLLRASGTTAVLVTHDQEEALSIADRVAVLRNGTVVQVSTPAELYDRPVDLGVATFVGDANVIEGTLEDGGVACSLGLLPYSGALEHGPVSALVRPEQIDITPGDSAVVLDRLYFGHDAMVILELDTGETVRARVQGAMPERNERVGLHVKGEVVCYPRAAVAPAGVKPFG